MTRFFFAVLLLLPVSPVLAQAPGKAPTAVIVATAKEKTFVDEIEALGTLKANESVELMSTVTELVTRIVFQDGQRVKQGDLLIEMDAAEELAERAEEQSTLNEAQRQYTRAKSLAAKGVSSKSTLDEHQLEFETAQARIQAIQSRIDKRRITAPFDGLAGLRNVSVGALVQPGTVITTIDDDSVMKLDFSVPAVFLPALKENSKIDARAKAFPGEEFTGTVSSLDSRVDPVTRSIVVRAIIENPERKLKPGILMNVTLKQTPRQALLIPEKALIISGTQSSVLVVTDKDQMKTVEQRNVELGARRKGEVEITSGLKAGDVIVTHGTLKVRPGMPITIQAEEKGDEPLTDLLNQKKEPAA